MTAATASAPEPRVSDRPDVWGVLGSSAVDPSAGRPPAEYFAQLLGALAGVGNAAGAAAWVADRGGFGLIAERGLSAAGFFDRPAAVRRNRVLLANAVRARANDGEEPSPREFGPGHPDGGPDVLVLPFNAGDGVRGALELFGTADRLRAVARPGAAGAVGELVVRYFEHAARAADAADPAALLPDFRALCRAVHGSLDPAAVAAAAANEARRLLGADRASVVVRRGRRWVCAAVSGQGDVRRRAAAVRGLESLAPLAVDGPVAFPGSPDDSDATPNRTSDRLAAYAAEHGARFVRLIPLPAPPPAVVKPDGESEKKFTVHPDRPAPPTGVLVVEQFAESAPHPAVAVWGEPVAEQTAAALSNAARHRRVPLSGVVDRVADRWEKFFAERRVPGRGAVLSGLAAAGLAAGCASLFVFEGDRTVGCAGRLVPAERRRVYAPESAEVAAVLVAGGARVEPGQPLLKLHSDTLEAERLAARGRLDELTQSAAALRAGLPDRGDRDSALRLQAEIRRTDTERRGLEAELALLDRRAAALVVRAPVAGTVTDFRPDATLAGRPVRWGDPLLEVADTAGPWQLELAVPGVRSAAVIEADAGRNAAGESGGGVVPVSYRLTADPAAEHAAVLSAVGTRAAGSDAPEGPSVPVTATLSGPPPAAGRVGADVRATVNCGRRPLAEVWFGDAANAVRRLWW